MYEKLYSVHFFGRQHVKKKSKRGNGTRHSMKQPVQKQTTSHFKQDPSSPKPADETGVRRQSYLTDKDLIVVLVCILAQSICHVGDPVSQMVHSIFTANAGDERENQTFQTNKTDVRVSDGVRFWKSQCCVKSIFTVHLSRTGSFQKQCWDFSHSHFSQLSIKSRGLPFLLSKNIEHIRFLFVLVGRQLTSTRATTDFCFKRINFSSVI